MKKKSKYLCDFVFIEMILLFKANVKLTHLEEQEKQTTEAVAAFTTALAGGPPPAHQYTTIEPPMSPTSLTRLIHGATPDNMVIL